MTELIAEHKAGRIRYRYKSLETRRNRPIDGVAISGGIIRDGLWLCRRCAVWAMRGYRCRECGAPCTSGMAK